MFKLSVFLMLSIAICFASTVSVAQESSASSTSTGTGSTNNTNTDSKPDKKNCRLQIHSTGCKQDGDCADFNGNPLECAGEGNSKVCRCPKGINCEFTPKNESTPQFGNCTKLGCTGGMGILGGKASGKQCAEPIGCVKLSKAPKGVQVTALCHTCSSCIFQGAGRYDCSTICPEGWKKRIPKDSSKSSADGSDTTEDAKDGKDTKGKDDSTSSSSSLLAASEVSLLSCLVISFHLARNNL